MSTFFLTIDFNSQKSSNLCFDINILKVMLNSMCQFLEVSVVSTNAGMGGGTGASLHYE